VKALTLDGVDHIVEVDLSQMAVEHGRGRALQPFELRSDPAV
jgi:hypothetical protein